MTDRFPVKVTPFFQAKVDDEARVVGAGVGPLSRIVLPVAGPANSVSLIPDFVGDHTNELRIGRARVIKKYVDRFLFLPTTSCLAHCRFCFRQDYMMEEPVERSAIEGAVEDLVGYLAEHPDVREIILSGGDPLAVPPSDLSWIVKTLLERTSVDVRVHTKAISFHPKLLLRDEVLKTLVQARVRTIFHVLHPYEICETVSEVLSELKCAGARFYNQFPVIAGVNDHSAVLLELLRVAEENSLRTVTIFAPEPIPGSSAYRVPLQRFYQLMDETTERSPSWLCSSRWVLDSATRKWQRGNITEWNRETGRIVFASDAETFVYNEPPLKDYVEPDIQTLLWRGGV